MPIKHTHKYVKGKHEKIAFCWCGRFKFINLKLEDIIIAQTHKESTKTKGS